ncbi:MAG TPA: anion permease, partial [Candidatus Scatomorpha merdigallinarum]|nr:anion permease [Candidatus Scatomorpha merdigallinarum]
MATGKSGSVKKVLFILATILMIAFFFIDPFPGLEPAGMRFLGIFIWWIVLLVTELMPNYLACLAALVLSIAVGSATFEQAFGSFASTTSVLLIGAFGLATALTNSGLLVRLALLVMKLFPGTYKGQIFAVSLASIIIAPTIPSTTAKSAVLIPIINNISDEMGYEPQSKGATGLISCCNTVTNCCGPMFMTGGIVATLMLSMYTGTIGWGDYFLFALVWG